MILQFWPYGETSLLNKVAENNPDRRQIHTGISGVPDLFRIKGKEKNLRFGPIALAVFKIEVVNESG
jgi:hypothetical protein